MGKIIQLMIIFFRKVICTRNTFNKKKLHECKKCQVFNKKNYMNAKSVKSMEIQNHTDPAIKYHQ